jgi:hypothetical protein
MLGHRPRADSLRSRSRFRADEVNGVSREKDLHLVTFVGGRARHEQP